MKTPFCPLFAVVAGVLLAGAGRADQNLTGNTVVEGRLGVGLPVTSPVTVPITTFQVNGHGVFRSGWPTLAWQDSISSEAFAARYLSTQNTFQLYYDPAFPSGDNRSFLSVGEDLGVTIGREGYSMGYALHVRGTQGRTGSLLISSQSTLNPHISFLGHDSNPRVQVGVNEVGGTRALTFWINALPGAGAVNTMAIHPSGVAGVPGNVAIGGSHSPARGRMASW
ncbi:MAG: hypothetical protein U1F77_06105 [Kiritimatiellia bacterium]